MAGKEALRFSVAGEKFAVPEASEVIAVEGFTPLPGAPPHLPGVCLVRGEVVPLVDLSALAGKGPHPTAKVVVARTDKGALAFYAEAVSGLEPLPADRAPLAPSGLKRFLAASEGVTSVDVSGLLNHFSR
jgi:purine-binding chemotaxis protein CheW